MDLSQSQQVSENQTIPEFYQNVILMRHGDRLDKFDPLWISTASKPWDPPLFKDGLFRVYETGRTLRNRLGFPVHRVFVSPFLRCVQTAAQVVTALCEAVDDGVVISSGAVSIDPSKVKVSIEYGLCEMLSSVAIRLDVAPKNGNCGFNIPEIEALLPAGTVDPRVEPVYKEVVAKKNCFAVAHTYYSIDMLAFRLKKLDATMGRIGNGFVVEIRADFSDSCRQISIKNSLLVTHREGVRVAVASFMEDWKAHGVDYCVYAELRRPIFKRGESFAAGKFKVLTQSEQMGVKYSSFTASNQ